jgi:hypothetical protein
MTRNLTPDELLQHLSPIRIGGVPFTIKVVAGVPHALLAREAQVDVDGGDITIVYRNQHGSIDSLFHEIMHVIWNTSGLQHTDGLRGHEEQVVTVMARAMMALFSDNQTLAITIDSILEPAGEDDNEA